MSKSGSKAALMGVKSALGTNSRRCVINPAASAPPVVYNVDEEGVGALPPTQSFAQGGQRFVDEQVAYTPPNTREEQVVQL